jgi:hypothetical protein
MPSVALAAVVVLARLMNAINTNVETRDLYAHNRTLCCQARNLLQCLQIRATETCA